VGPELAVTPRTTGCPSCGASMRVDAHWCGQCHADFRPKPAPEPAPAPPTSPAPTAAYGVAAGDPLTQPLVDFLPPVPTSVPLGQPAVRTAAVAGAVVGEPTWPCTRCETVNVLSASVCITCGGGFLAAMKQSEKSLLVLPVVGDLGAMSRGRRAALALGVAALIVLPLALLTLLLTQRPAAKPPNAPGTSTSSTTDGSTTTTGGVPVDGGSSGTSIQ
jgi:hypothetical protein